jgi:ABC-type antimicrobial peptide transport system permease subunit
MAKSKGFLPLRMRADVRTTKETLTQTVQAIDPELPVYGVGTMEELVSTSIARRRFSLFLMSSFAALALLLATLGIYGVMAFLVNQRVQEFSIRLALGAQARDIIMLALRPGLILISIGSFVGLAVSIAVTHSMSGLIFGVFASDPVTFSIVPLVLGIVALAACFIPARYASRISPAEILRS